MTLSAVLAITLLQVAPPVRATEPPQNEPLNVNLVARFEDTNGVAASLAGSTITGTNETTIYRLDLSLSCGVLEPGPFASDVSSPADNAFVGLAEDIQIQLNALRIIRYQGPDEWDMPIDCPLTSRVIAYLVIAEEWIENSIPQGATNYFVGQDYPFPTLTTFDSGFNFLTTSRLNRYSNGFEIEWDSFSGATGFTPSGYGLRYRQVFDGQEERGPWIYIGSDDGRLESLIVQDPLPAWLYEVQIAPSFIDCESNRHFGAYESIPLVGQFGLDTGPEAALAPSNPQAISGEVVSQCSNSPAAPVITTPSTLEVASTNFPYSQFIAANGSNLTYALTVEGSLPTGLSLNAGTGEISGTSARLGDFAFSVTVTDTVTNLSDTEEFTLSVNDVVELPIEITKGGVTWHSVGSGILDVETNHIESTFDSGTMKAYWLNDFSDDPFEIGCPDDLGTRNVQPEFTSLYCNPNNVSEVLTSSTRHFFANSDPWHQLEVTVNNTDTEEQSGFVKYVIDLGADSNTEIEMTSDGDLLIENSDAWFVTSGGNSDLSATTLHYFGSTSDQTVTQGSGQNRDKIYILRPVTLAGGAEEVVRFVDGVVDFAPTTQSDSVITAIKAADQLENATFRALIDQETNRANVLDVSLQAISDAGTSLPALRTIFECNDFGKQALYPVLVDGNAQPIGCDMGLTDSGEGGPGPGGEDLNWGLAPGGLDEFGRPETWISQFQSTFPNAAPRFGWACDQCFISSEGPISMGSMETPNGIPLGFTTNHFGSEDFDSVRIFPNGAVQLHSSLNGNDQDQGRILAAFGNLAMSNGSIQGEWQERPDYDFFYWGRTLYQGRIAFVVTWVNIPTTDYSGDQSGDPIPSLEPSTMQLILVSDSNLDAFEGYVSSNPQERTTSDMDIVWNYKSIQSQGAIPLFESQNNYPEYAGGPFFSGLLEQPEGVYPLISEEDIANEGGLPVGMGQNAPLPDENCDEACVANHIQSNPDLENACNAACVASNLLSNRLQSPVNGRYVLGFREYEIASDNTLPKGFPAPAAPRAVEVNRVTDSEVVLSWSAPVPWVLQSFAVPDGNEPIYGYRIQYLSNERNTDESCDEDDPAACTIYPALTDPPLTVSDEEVTITGSGESERISINIPSLQANTNYVFRVFAVYAGIDSPPAVDENNNPILDENNEPIQNDLLFINEVRSAPAYATELYESVLDINPIANQVGQEVTSARYLASAISGEGVTLSNATINGFEFIDGTSAKSVGTFTGGQDSIGFSEGIVLAPLVDARTFQRGSGVTNTDSGQSTLNTFSDPNARQLYGTIQNQFNDYLSTQKSWLPGPEESGLFSPVCNDDTCANGTTYLQFDVAPTEDFLKFEYVLAGTEPEYTGELYEYPDGFGLFVDGIDQASSCALIPQVAEETLEERFVSMGNARNARLAELVRFDSDLHAQSVTSTLTCQADVAAAREANEAVTITMVIANARDGVLSPAVFVKANSVRFEETSIDLIDIAGGFQYQSYEGNSFTSTGTAVSRWTATGLPDGLTMNTEGFLQGTPLVSGSYSFTVIAYGENDLQLASQTFTIVVEPSEMGQDRFLRGDYVEVGIAGNGHFGSSGPAPEGFHPRDPGDEGGPGGPGEGSSVGRIGFISDRDRDGWGVGQDDGDFFVPGTPFESFGVSANGFSLINDNERTDILGIGDEPVDSGSQQSSTWVSSTLENGLRITQVASVPEEGQTLDVQVTFDNLSDAEISGLSYARQVDNDANVFACSQQGSMGGWNSLNRIEAQADSSDGISLVSSRMSDDCGDNIEGFPDLESNPYSYLGLISTDSRSVGALQLNDFGSQRASHFVTGISSSECEADRGDADYVCMDISIAPGSEEFDDSGIGMGFDIGDLAAGQSTTITFSYILSPEQAQEIIDDHNGENNLIAPSISLSRSNLAALVDSAFEVGELEWLTNTGGDASFFTISPQLPTGMSFNTATGEITGTPTVPSDTTRYTLTANNLAGSSSAEFLLAVIAEPYLYTDDDGRLMAAWPSDSPASVGNYEYSLSSSDGVTWGQTDTITNSSQPIMSMHIDVNLGESYRIRVRPSGSDVEWAVSDNYFYGLTGCTRNNSPLNVLLLSTPETESSAGTNPATTDRSLRNAICQSELVSLEVFDGLGYALGAVKGSADVWENELENIDVVVLPKLTSGSLFGSDLMSNDAADELSDWVHQGGRLILTGSSGYITELNDLNGLEPNSIEAVTVSEELGGRREDAANTSLPYYLPTFGQSGIAVWGINSNYYVDHYGETSNWDSTSLATTFSVTHGSVVAFSNDFETVNQDWNQVLRQAVHSTVSHQIMVNENDNYWYVTRGELYSSAMETGGSSIVRLGSRNSPTTISCVNTTLNPAVVTRNTQGTTVVCGSVLVDDGVVATAPEVRLTRFFAANTPWVKTSILIENNDGNNAYENSMWFGGDLGLGDTSLLEYQGRQVTESEDDAYRSRVIIASQGTNIKNSHGDGNGSMAVTVSGQLPDYIYGGATLEDDYAFTRNQLWSETEFVVDSNESRAFSWFSAYMQFEPGCDRYASMNTWSSASSFLSDSEDEFSLDNFEANSSLRFPNLSDLDCERYDAIVENVEINSSNGRVNIEWDRPNRVDRYELEYRESGTNDWTHLDEFDTDEEDRESYNFGGLEEGQTYEFRIRPIDRYRNEAGDTAKGIWATTAEVYIAIPPSPSPSSSSSSPSPSASPSSSPSSSQSPSVNNSGPDLSATIVPQMVAQAGPGFPARLKKGKTVKFGMTAPSGLPLRVSSVGRCKTTAITKKVTVKVLVGKKIKKKKVKVQTGWAVKGTKKGLCTVTFSNSGDATRNPLAAAGTITIF